MFWWQELPVKRQKFYSKLGLDVDLDDFEIQASDQHHPLFW